MPDREKVIEALHCRAYDDDLPCSICAYYRPNEKPVAKCDYRGLMDDAIALLKEQETANVYKCPNCGTWVSAENVVRCKDCRFLIEHYGFMDDGYCRNMRDEHNIKFKPDKDWFCADGERR